MIDTIKKLENTKYQNEHKYTKGVSYNYGIELALNEIEKATDYEGILNNLKDLLKLVLTDVRFSDECYEGITDVLVIVKNYIKLHEQYLEMCYEEFKYSNDWDYGISNDTVYLYHEGLTQQRLYDLIDETAEIIAAWGLLFEVDYNEEFERNEFKITGKVGL